MPANSPGNILPDFQTFTREEWKERIAAFSPPGPDVFSLEQSEVVLQGVIPWEYRYSAILDILGYSYVDDDLKLRRVLPLFHPWYEYMSAVGVSIHGKKPKVPDDKLPDDPDGYNTKVLADDPDNSFDYSNYESAEVVIRFKQQPWEFLEDDEVDFEYKRYTYDVTRQGSLDVISLQTGLQLKFAEGPAGVIGTVSPAELGVWAHKDVINICWRQIPKDFIMSSALFAFGEGYAAAKISACVGCVNETDFLGFPAGTLMLHAPVFDRFQWPLRTTGLSAFGYHVTFPFQYFDPEKGVASIYRGHNLQPFPQPPGNGKWYLATRGGAVTDPGFLPTAEFRDMFTHVDS